MPDEEKIQEAKDFYNDRIIGWMIADLRKSIGAGTNFLTALGCVVYTEIIGIFLPPLSNEKGSTNRRRFYRCFYRLKSNDYLRELDKMIINDTNKCIYEHLRHNMAHKYYPAIKKRHENIFLFIPTVVARDGFAVDPSGSKRRSAPLFIDNKSRVVIATRNYIDELKLAVKEFYNKTFKEKNPDFQKAAVEGTDVVLRGKV